MIFIPLGLFVPIHRMPWMTLFIAFATIVLSLRNFSLVENLDELTARSETQLRVISLKLKMLASLCRDYQILGTGTCHLLEQVSLRPVENLSGPAEQIQRGLSHGLRNQQDLDLIKEFVFSSEIPEKFLKRAKASKDYSAWMKAKDQLSDERNQVIGRYGFLSRTHWNFLSLLKAQVTHAGWIHLIGNLLFFGLVSIFVELRLGSLPLLGLYTLAGFGGLSVELWHMKSVSTPLLGASANIAGVGGAFAALFWHKRVKVLASFLFMFNRIISIPVYFFFPILVFSQDLVGALDPKHTGVAHLAHLSGFSLGFGIAFFLKKQDQLPQEFLSKEELETFERIRSFAPKVQIPHYIDLLKMNPENPLIHVEILRRIEIDCPWAEIKTQLKNYIVLELPNFLFLEKSNPRIFLTTLELVPESWPLKLLLGKISGRELLRLSGLACEDQKFSAGHRILRYLWEEFPEIAGHQEWLRQSTLIEENQNLKRGIHGKTG